jgi:hypothetical protein
VTQRVMNYGDQVRKLLWSHRVVPNVAADDHNRGNVGWSLRYSRSPLCPIVVNDHVGPKGNKLKVSESPLGQLRA